MREQGMTNQEIADSLDVHYETILKLIGKQPKGLRKPYGSRCKKAGPAHEEETYEACLTIKRPALEICGRKWKYRASIGQNMVEVFTAPDVTPIALDLEDLPQIIKELQALERNSEKITGGNVLEVW